MAWSLNALLDIPTREEKERQRSQGQAAVDRLSEMERADELARGHEEFSKDLGLKWDNKKYEEDLKRDVENLMAGGMKKDEAERTAKKSKTEGMLKSLLGIAGAVAGLETGLPAKEVTAAAKEADAKGAKADAEKAASKNAKKAEKGKAPYAFKGGELQAQTGLAETKLRETNAILGIDAAPDIAATAAAVREQTRAAAEEYKNAGAQRAMEHANNLMRLEQQQGFLKRTMNDPLYQAIGSGIDPRAYGAGTAYGSGALPLPGGQSAGVSPQGMLKRKSAAEALDEALGSSVKTD